MNQKTPSPHEQTRRETFGTFLHHVRTEVYAESLEAFGRRVHLSKGYLGKLERAEVPIPPRDTVEQLATNLSVDPATILTKAGFTTEEATNTHLDLIALKLAHIRPEARQYLLDLIEHFLAKYPNR